MKIKCPICGIEGFLEKRGNSYRVKHYKGYVDGKRIYVIHSLSKEHIAVLGIKGLDGNQWESNFGNKKPQNKALLVRGVGFEPTNPYGTAASGLRLWPGLATPAF